MLTEVYSDCDTNITVWIESLQLNICNNTELNITQHSSIMILKQKKHVIHAIMGWVTCCLKYDLNMSCKSFH